MVRKSTWMALNAIAYTPLTTAWTLTWRNETAGASIEHQDTALTCTRIYHEKGEDFSWDPEGAWCMDFWAEPTCDTRIGYSCDGRVWKKAASRNLSAFDVYPMPVESRRVYGFLSTSTTPSPTAAATTLTVTHPAATSATQTAEAEGDSGSSLSGGAIAGIVVGAVAGLGLLAALCFFLGKRKPKNAHTAPEVPLSPALPPPPAAGLGAVMSRTDTNRSYPTPYTPHTQPAAFPIEHKSPMSGGSGTQSMYSAAPPYSPPASVYQPPSAARVVELPGNYNQLSEMDGSSDVKRPLN
ncbi:hypothetical protein ATEIFO6365_0009017200 [Aspergillus terreus]|uniref:Uncharacterized protein n=1 Tax=Aspergillus terreus TaxID=33178 RepID=A0A5M3Z7P0_ASPTE|nr:hypothetical protein ATETN484_0011017200 [Aspergillus terreus]GFF18809.1 hypothetical protein ATEIFO6365_0009017200 [Aspergillus terreus]